MLNVQLEFIASYALGIVAYDIVNIFYCILRLVFVNLVPKFVLRHVFKYIQIFVSFGIVIVSFYLYIFKFEICLFFAFSWLRISQCLERPVYCTVIKGIRRIRTLYYFIFIINCGCKLMLSQSWYTCVRILLSEGLLHICPFFPVCYLLHNLAMSSFHLTCGISMFLCSFRTPFCHTPGQSIIFEIVDGGSRHFNCATLPRISVTLVWYLIQVFSLSQK